MRTIVVTGASSGLGLAAAERLAARGDQVVVVGRDPGRLGAAMARIRAAATGPEPDEFRADFTSLDQVRRLADHVLAAYPAVDVLANNAGAMLGAYRRTEDGLEATMAGNHLAPFLLTGLLRDALRGGRVVNTASQAHRRRRPGPEDFTWDPAAWHGWPAYCHSKAANILFTAEAARRWPDILSVAFHPGVVRTNFATGTAVRVLWARNPLLTGSRKAGDLLTWLATAPAEELRSGAYYVGRKVARPDSRLADPALAARLWDASEEAVHAGRETAG
ncbi:SDR family NAD(P)-dependent oxidoreductase [Pseudosporangium ferrugineum]|uniref:Daunorubicin C-13 ketoreductase n=1 Tax=Pseudosporangium ferrugineum TaxID=439699 RepID=A0A2T0S9M6_9ACTN|nr:SDR family NAD(P)-dependent oxidoreductase [Pseudosporangium ferrugineum]PRY30106.1 daunorubicin C-13 ketoreductase [Pseudosporangium ferrugineum]